MAQISTENIDLLCSRYENFSISARYRYDEDFYTEKQQRNC
jgi:hypothetical protein